MIPWASPLAQYRAQEDAIRAAMTRVLDSGNYILGAEVEAFERAFAAYCGVAHAVGVGNGTDALTLALRALGVASGDEVITVSHTAVATVAAILACGATPVLVDVDRTYFTMDPRHIEGAITSRTKAVVAVHLYGQPAELEAVSEVVRRRNVALVEDCAQAVGAEYLGRRVGSWGDIASFSFYPTKNLGAIGDGGMVVTTDSELATRVKRCRQYGWDQLRNTEEIGVNSRLDPLQAAILNAKLPHLDADNVRRGLIADRYNRSLSDLPISLPVARPQCRHVYHLYVVRCAERDRLRAHLEAEEIGSALHYPVPAHRHHGYAERSVISAEGLPVTEALASEILSLPIYPELGDADVDEVIASIRRFYTGSR
jgi:dTDP-4-amino-4,6-dideoxygalactose transaminase